MVACTTTPASRTSQVQISSEQDAGRATTSLLAKVDLQEKEAHWERAAALLERALRIEPRNAQLWYRLARIHLQQGQYHRAISLAEKSNALARDDAELQMKNERILKQARALSMEETFK